MFVTYVFNSVCSFCLFSGSWGKTFKLYFPILNASQLNILCCLCLIFCMVFLLFLFLLLLFLVGFFYPFALVSDIIYCTLQDPSDQRDCREGLCWWLQYAQSFGSCGGTDEIHQPTDEPQDRGGGWKPYCHCVAVGKLKKQKNKTKKLSVMVGLRKSKKLSVMVGFRNSKNKNNWIYCTVLTVSRLWDFSCKQVMKLRKERYFFWFFWFFYCTVFTWAVYDVSAWWEASESPKPQFSWPCCLFMVCSACDVTVWF